MAQEIVSAADAAVQPTPETPANGAAEKKRRSAAKIAWAAGRYLLLTVIAAFFLFPFFVMICLSILPNKDILARVLFPTSGKLYLGAYRTVVSGASSNFMKGLGNTLIVATVLTVGIPFVSALCAYGFAKMQFVGKEIVFGIVLSTMMIPAVISMVPLYFLYAKFHFTNTLYPMFVPSLFGGGATNIFLMRQFMRGIPNDMIKAAQLDGASSFLIFLRMVIPLCMPIMLYVGVMSFMGAWNDFLTPFTYLSDTSSKWATLAFTMYIDYGAGSRVLANQTMAAGVLMTLPCIILFFVFQRYLIEGVAITGMKD